MNSVELKAKCVWRLLDEACTVIRGLLYYGQPRRDCKEQWDMVKKVAEELLNEIEGKLEE